MYKYEIIMYRSDEDQVFVAEVPEFPDCAAVRRPYCPVGPFRG